MNYFAIFPGQGSQSIGMLAEFNEAHPSVKRIFNDASRALDFDLFALTQHDETALNLTENTQPALLAAGVACYEVWQRQEVKAPKLLAGHSLGEYTALVCAGAINLADAVKIVALRGRLMQQAVPEGEGAMAAIIGLSDEDVNSICEQASEQGVVSAANYNCPGQVVISGHMAAVKQACALAQEKEARLCKILPVSVPSHSSLMASAADGLSAALENIRISKPEIPVIHNVDVDIHSHPDDIREALVKQLTQPVRWVETIQRGIIEGVSTTIEFGPGRVLLGLNKRIDRQVRHFAVYDQDTLDNTLQHISKAEA